MPWEYRFPQHVDFLELANVRFLEDVFLDPAEVLMSTHAGHADGDLVP